MAKSSAKKIVPATQFKAQCLALIDRVAQGKGTVVISKRGRPVARLVPLTSSATERRSLVGSVRIMDERDDLFSTGVDWEAGLPSRAR
jgi:prevent-host-death family protein